MKGTIASLAVSFLVVTGASSGPITFRAQQTFAMQGTVIEFVSGQPIPDALIVFMGNAGYARANSDSAGRFVAEGMDRGEYKVQVTREGYFWLKSRSGPAVIDVTGDVRNVTYRLLRGSAISGRILDPTGHPDSGMSVSLLRVEYRDGMRVLSAVNAPAGSRTSTATDRKGEYRLYGIAPGEYYLVTSGTDSTTYYPGTADVNAAVAIVVAPGRDLAGVSMTQVQSHTYTVTVTVELAQGQGLNDPSSLLSTIRPRDSSNLMDVRTNSGLNSVRNNRYVISGLRPGEYDLTLTLLSPRRQAGPIAFDITDHDMDLGTVALSPGITISGRIQSADPRLEVKDMAVRLNPANGALGFSASGVSRDQGVFSLSDVQEGPYWVDLPSLSRDIYRDVYLESVRYGARQPVLGDVLVGKDAEGPLEIVLSIGSVVTGFVRNARGEVVPYGPVLLYPTRGRQRPSFFKITETDRNGAFKVVGVGPGEYRVLAWEDSLPVLYLDPRFLSTLESRAANVTVQSGAAATVDVRVVPAMP